MRFSRLLYHDYHDKHTILPGNSVTSQSKAKTKERAVLVTTAHRGVFFGFASDTKGDTIELKRARNVLYWSADVGGFMGLAANGPTSGCRIGPACDIEVRNVTSVSTVTPDAEAKWLAAK